MPVNIVTMTVIVVLVLVLVVFFFMSSSGTGMGRSQATQVFFEACNKLRCNSPADVCLEVYRQVPGHDQAFYDNFYSACQNLYGGDRNNALMCLSMCGNCVKLTDTQKGYILGNGEGVPVDLDGVLQKCSSVPR